MTGADPLDHAAVAAALAPLTRRFSDAGHSLFLVGGVVRDLALGDHGVADDIDCTTDARPAIIRQLVEPVATALWTQGERFGTIGATVAGRAVEITTHRAESYDPTSRKPVVAFGDDLETDLSRRDFTINAMAIDLADGSVHDPFDGQSDLAASRLATPLDPSISFSDDPLRMLRAARFAARFGLAIDPEVVDAARELRGRIGIVSVERIHDELERLLALDDPSSGLEFLLESGVFAEFGPTIGADGRRTAIERAGARSPVADHPLSNGARRTLLLSTVTTGDAADWLASMRYSIEDRRRTTKLRAGVAFVLALDEGRDGSTIDPAHAVRRLADDVGLDQVMPLLDVVDVIGGETAHLRAQFERLDAIEDLSDLDPPIGGGELMARLGLRPGPVIGELMARLREERIVAGPFSADEAVAMARKWLDP